MDRYSELPQFLRTTGAFEHRATEAVEPADDHDGRSPLFSLAARVGEQPQNSRGDPYPFRSGRH